MRTVSSVRLTNPFTGRTRHAPPRDRVLHLYIQNSTKIGRISNSIRRGLTQNRFAILQNRLNCSVIDRDPGKNDDRALLTMKNRDNSAIYIDSADFFAKISVLSHNTSSRIVMNMIEQSETIKPALMR